MEMIVPLAVSPNTHTVRVQVTSHQSFLVSSVSSRFSLCQNRGNATWPNFRWRVKALVRLKDITFLQLKSRILKTQLEWCPTHRRHPIFVEWTKSICSQEAPWNSLAKQKTLKYITSMKAPKSPLANLLCWNVAVFCYNSLRGRSTLTSYYLSFETFQHILRE